MNDKELEIEMENNFDNNYKFNIYAGLIASFITVLGNNYLVTLVKQLGGNDVHITLLSALPPLMIVLGLIPSTILMQSSKNFRKTILFMYLLAKSFYLFFVVAILINTKYTPLLIVIFAALQSLPTNLHSSGYQSWIAKMFKPSQRNLATAKRNQFSFPVTALTSLLLGFLLSFIKKNDFSIMLFNHKILIDSLFIYISCFIIAFICSFIEFYFLSKLKGVDEIQEHEKFIVNLKKVFSKDNKKNLRNLFVYIAILFVYYFAWILPQGVFNINLLDRLHATEFHFGLISLIGLFSQFFFVFFWIKLAKKIGTLKTLAICMFTMSINGFVHIYSPNITVYIILQIISGLPLSGMGYLLANALLLVTEKENKAIYVSLYTTIVSVISFVSPLIGNVIRKSFTDFNQGIVFVLWLTIIGRIIGSIIFYFYAKTKNVDEN